MSTLTPPPTSAPTLSVHTPIHGGVTLLAVAASVALLYFGRVFFITVVVASVIAFLLDPIVTAFVKLRLPRAVASFIVCSIALLMLYFIGLGLYSQVSGFAEDLPNYSERMNGLVDNVATRVEQFEKRTYQVIIPKRFQEAPAPPGAQPPDNARRRRATKAIEPPPAPPAIAEVRIHPEPTPLLTYVYGYVRSFYDVLLMASFVPFLVYFMLSWRDHMRRSFLYLFSGPGRQVA